MRARSTLTLAIGWMAACSGSGASPMGARPFDDAGPATTRGEGGPAAPQGGAQSDAGDLPDTRRPDMTEAGARVSTWYARVARSLLKRGSPRADAIGRSTRALAASADLPGPSDYEATTRRIGCAWVRRVGPRGRD
jgi:hypothetical protein